MRKTLISLFALAVVFVALPASADTACTISGGNLQVAVGGTCYFDLTTSNNVALDGAVVRVTVDDTGGATTLGFQFLSAPIANPVIGIDRIGYNIASNGVGGGFDSPGGGACAGGPVIACGGNIDGFGSFLRDGAESAGTGGVSSPIVITLAGHITSVAPNANGDYFVVHVRFGGECSGFIGGPADSRSQDPAGGCGGTQVPEPGSLALFGSGLIGLAGVLRRRLIG